MRALKEAKKAAAEQKELSATASAGQERASDLNPLQSTDMETPLTKIHTFKNILDTASGLGLKKKLHFADVVGQAMAGKGVDRTKKEKNSSVRSLVSMHRNSQHESKDEQEDANALPIFYPPMMQVILDWKNRAQLRVAIRRINTVERRHRNKFHLDNNFQTGNNDKTDHFPMHKRDNSSTLCNCQGLQEDVTLLESTVKDEFKRMNNLILNLTQKFDERNAGFSLSALSSKGSFLRSKVPEKNSNNERIPGGDMLQYEFVEKECGCNVS